jgi:hypothetical protein
MAGYVMSGGSRGARLRLPGAAGVVLLGLGLAACAKLGLGAGVGAGDQMSWAKAALERNSRLDVIASDPQTGTFTVRMKDTGELRMIRVNEVVGGPPGSGTSSGAAPSATRASLEPPSPQGTAAPATASAAAAPSSSLASSSTPPGESRGASPAESGNLDGAREVPNPNSDVASITPGGRTLESGPGYVIKTASKVASAAGIDPQRAPGSTAGVERRHDPIICQGDRLLQIDNRNLEFDGDAVAAQDGCEIHITNSHIRARGVGVSARAANVHIDNSQIEGNVSVDASGGAQVYVSSSSFKGMSRRLDTSSFHDLGGNVWN